MAEDGKFMVEKFNGQKFPLWKMQIEYYLYQKYLYLPLSEKNKEADDYDRRRIEYSRYKGTHNSTVMPRGIDSLQYF